MKKFFLFGFVCLILINSVLATDFSTNNILFYSFDNSKLSGNDPLDSSPYSNDGVNNGATTGVSGALAEAFDFDGTTSYVNANTLINDISTDTAGTFACWVNFDDITTQGIIVSVGDTDASSRFELKNDGTGLLTAGMSTGGSNQWFVDTDNTILVTGNYHLLGVTQDGTSPILYYDDTTPAQAFYVDTDKTKWFNNDLDLDNVRFGDRNYNNNGEITFLNGKLDSCYYFNYALTSTQFTELYNSGTPIDPYPASSTKTFFTIHAKTNKTLATLTDFNAILYSNNDTFTGSTSNGTIYMDIPLNDYLLNVTSIGYATKIMNLTQINNSNTTTAYLNDNNSISINIYDGVGLYLLNNTEISISINGNNTGYYSKQSTTNGTYFLSNLAADKYNL